MPKEIDINENNIKEALKELNNGAALDAVMKKHKLDRIEITAALSAERARIDDMLNSAKPVSKKITLRVFEEDGKAFTAISKHIGETQSMVFHKIVGHYLQSHSEVLAKSDAGK